jgi:uncharacterized phiE125 gp8 family phage protein
MLIARTRAEGLVVSVAEAKRRMFVDEEVDDFDEDIEKMIRAATAMVEHHTKRILLPAEYEYHFDGWSESLCMPVVPIRSILDVTYLDGSNVEQSIDANDWFEDRIDDRGAEIRFVDAFARPALSTRPRPVRIVFEAGYDDPDDLGTDPRLLPDPRDAQMVLFLAAHWFKNRESATEKPLTSIPDGFHAMAAQRRIYR